MVFTIRIVIPITDNILGGKALIIEAERAPPDHLQALKIEATQVANVAFASSTPARC
jgi:hypothetical protein